MFYLTVLLVFSWVRSPFTNIEEAGFKTFWTHFGEVSCRSSQCIRGGKWVIFEKEEQEIRNFE